MTIGDLFMYIFFTGLMAMPVIDIAAIGTQLTQAFAGLDRIREILSLPAEDEEDASRVVAGEIHGEVEFENVWFEYNAGVPVLRNLPFKAPAGSTTAPVGSSGSGKSTLISLVMNFNSPLSGRIKIDGRELSTIRLCDYRSHLGIVLQDNFLAEGRVRRSRMMPDDLISRKDLSSIRPNFKGLRIEWQEKSRN